MARELSPESRFVSAFRLEALKWIFAILVLFYGVPFIVETYDLYRVKRAAVEFDRAMQPIRERRLAEIARQASVDRERARRENDDLIRRARSPK